MSASATITSCYYGGTCEQTVTSVVAYVDRFDVGTNPPRLTVRGACSMHADALAHSISRDVSGWPTSPEVLVVGPALTTRGTGGSRRYAHGHEVETVESR